MIYPDNFEAKIGFDRIRTQVEALCATAGAVGKLRAETFSSSHDEVRRRLALVDEMRTVLMMESDFPDGGFVDTDAFLRKARIEGTFLDVHEIVALRKALAATGELVAFFRRGDEIKYPSLHAFSDGVDGFPAIVNHIDSIIDKFGKVRDNASAALYAVRRSIREREGQVSKRLQQIMSQAQAAGIVEADAAVSIREGRAVIPVAAGNKKKLKGFIHDESATGKTIYIEPVEVVELNNEIKELEYEERREIVRILADFTDKIRPDLDGIAGAADYLTGIDMIRAKGRHALANQCVRPILADGTRLELRHARHPLLAQALAREGGQVVPLDLWLTPEKHLLVISGPNAGGKSVCLKTVGLLQYMFQCGYLIPVSENSEIGLFDGIFIDIGDEQSIENDLSTYSSHLLNMKHMLAHAGERSLVLIDEFGTGTEPVIGGAIAESILERLRERRCFGVITTHYANLKYYASNAEGIANGAMTFDVQNIRPLFRLEIGTPGSSFAVEIARKIGLPEPIIRSAIEKAGSDHMNIERQLREISRDKRYWEQKRDRIRIAEKRVDELAEKYGAELAQLKDERSRLIREAKSEAQRLTAEANRQIENTIRTIKESQAEKEATRIVRRKLDDFRENLAKDDEADERIARKIAQLREREERRMERKQRKQAEATPAKSEPEKVLELKEGAKVRIKEQDTVGEVLTIKGKKVTVAFGQITTTLDRDRLVVVSNAEFKKQGRDLKPAIRLDAGISQRRLHFKHTLDVRGMRAAEALDEVQDFVDDAIMVGATEVRILHGKGTGALKEEIRRYLRTVSEVASADDEHVDQGGAGITVVRLR
ncbi:MAG: Smr/MutS family protein [Rikenellaceae bacterium]|nr:Smr/MutS family protein [Rikenellaceae bacterium]